MYVYSVQKIIALTEKEEIYSFESQKYTGFALAPAGLHAGSAEKKKGKGDTKWKKTMERTAKRPHNRKKKKRK